MKGFSIKRSLVIGATLLIFSTNAFCEIFLKNDGIVDKRAVEQIELMGKELKQKTGVNTYVFVANSLGEISLLDYEKNLTKSLKIPYILLSLVKKKTEVDIKASEDMLDKFDREGVLSPFPLNGTILPILGSKKGKDKVSAAILNGYADIVDQVASSYSIKLDSSIGSANKTVVNIVRAIFYSLSIISIGLVFYFKRKKKLAKEA